MTHGYFVTGTDSSVGKTLACTALLHHYATQGLRAVGMKAIASGSILHEGEHTNPDVLRLQAAGNVEAPPAWQCPYLLHAPLSPHFAADAQELEISLSYIAAAYRKLSTLADVVIVEGSGGFRVPLAAELDGADLAAALDLPVILVVGIRHGCSNHALLTQESILARGLRLAGWIACRTDPNLSSADEKVRVLTQRLQAPLLGDIPYLPNPDARAAAAHLDTAPLHQASLEQRPA